MKVLSADFVTSAAAQGAGIPRDSLPQVALAGRSNVGKSSLINALTRRTIARTSAAPGKTRLANIYRVELDGAGGPGRFALYLVDLPGYGYARRSAPRHAEGRPGQGRGTEASPPEPAEGRSGADSDLEFQRVAETYFSGPSAAGRQPRTALLLIDSRHPGLESDRQAAAWLDSLGVDTHIVATKIDKLTRSERARNLKAIGDIFGTAALPVSAASGEGLDALWKTIVRIGRDAGRDG